ncbi:MAG: hypothetical protein HY320_14050, partial [Armatimonadetes bacterium]|nr:hypothetical protein [Armatimonadota bacterium]
MQSDVTLVPIQTTLYRRIESSLDRLQQSSVEAFVEYVVRAALAPLEGSGELSPAEEAEIV